MFGGGKQRPAAELRAEWSRELSLGAVELVAGRRVVARVDHEGVLLVARDLFVAWAHLGFADGSDPEPGLLLPKVPGTLTLTVSRPWWAEHIAGLTGRPRRRAERELKQGWARPTVPVVSRETVPVETFAEWLSAEAVTRAPLPDRFCLSPDPETSVSDRDTNRPVPLDRLPISHTLRDRIAAWGAAAGEVPEEQRILETTWEPFWTEGRPLAADLETETGRSAAVWADCPDVP
ncbi:hypothetical protein [uncultured Nocardioides sp.]|uniref:hypothetical protein n=1 Tax=uncultured Nocardioides sp. TaxID=198441 RepID=UPI0030FA454F